MKYLIWILAGAVIFLGFSQWSSCEASKLAGRLIAEKKVMQHQQDSIQQNERKAISTDSVLRISTVIRNTKDSLTIDSLRAQNKIYRLKYSDVKVQLIQTLSDITGAVDSGSDNELKNEVNRLKDQLGTASATVDNMQTNTGQQDSVMISEISFRDSVIIAKNITIDKQQTNFKSLQLILEQTKFDRDQAIKALQKGKRTNILRTIGEVLLVIGLMFKK